jgi:hypothetical protein
LKTRKETITVHLGPSWFFNKKIKLHKGDIVEIEGSRISYALRQIIVANKIKKGNLILVLRDEQGTPLWTGKGKRSRNAEDTAI